MIFKFIINGKKDDQMIYFYQQIPSTKEEFLYGKIGSSEISDKDLKTWNVKLFKSERDARVDWIRSRYSGFRNLPDNRFNDQGYPI